MSEKLTPMRRWIEGEISAGKFCELVNVPRHVGEEDILHAVFQLKEERAELRAQVQRLQTNLRADTETIADLRRQLAATKETISENS